MQHYVITLIVQAGEYQKLITHLITARTIWKAEKAAIENEAHDDLEWTSASSAYDLNGEFHYSIQATKICSSEDFQVLKKYL